MEASREALSLKDYLTSRDAASQVLDYEPDNYNATVFLALSLLELGQLEESEQAYNRATKLNPENPLAWQGLSKYYERTERWKDYADSLVHLIDLHRKLSDSFHVNATVVLFLTFQLRGNVVKCAESWQHLYDFQRERGTRLQVIDAMLMLIPPSHIHEMLSMLPPPDMTNPASTATFNAQTAIHDSLTHLETTVQYIEMEEDETLRKEVEKRRTRLGAPNLEILKDEVGREIWAESKLPLLYDEIINHPRTSDELRRSTEAKLLRHKQRYLYAIPNTPEFAGEKSKMLEQVDGLIQGAIILKIPDEQAWTMHLESMDCENVSGYDRELVKSYIMMFPSSPISTLLKGYFLYKNIPLSKAQDDSDNESIKETEKEDPFDTILEAYTIIPSSNIGNRVLSEVCISEHDYQNALKAAESGMELLNRLEKSTGRNLANVRIGYQASQATSLVHLFPPKYHSRALNIIDDVLSESKDNIPCLMGRAFILVQAKKWHEAATSFTRVVELLPANVSDGIRAREERAWCCCQIGGIDDGLASLKSIVTQLRDLNENSQDIARCLWRIGKCYWNMGDDHREEAYRYFILSLKSDPSYAPAFTSLGMYYAECAYPPDPNRASKCFQKAFELDPREAEAARRLAEGFAEDREWDLVEVITRRTIEGEGGIDAGMGDVRYLPTNAWAWKALGAVELHHRNYLKAVAAFQIALRADSDDPLSWLRLGECYSQAGRHVAAVKALEKAQELDPQDWICHYLIGHVKYQMGHHHEAISAFESILASRPAEVGVLMALGQTYLDKGRIEFEEGFHSRGEQSLLTSVSVGLRLNVTSTGFGRVIWKIVGDALFTLSTRPTYDDESTVRQALQNVLALCPTKDKHLSDVIPATVLSTDASITGMQVLEVAIAVYSYRTTLGSSEIPKADGSAWFDLGVGLLSWTIKSSGQTTGQPRVISFLSQALRKDPENGLYWVGLGNAYFTSNARGAQHAYIKAIELDTKNVAAWTSLGLLYLYYNDIELANQALHRAQTLDPDYAMAWIAQALIATQNGHDADAVAILEHAIGLAPNVPEGDVEYSCRSFRQYRLTSNAVDCPLQTLLPTFFVLRRYCERRPDDATGLHLYALICEGLGHLETAAAHLALTTAILEASYEISEDPTVERQFSIANTNLGRIRLALRDYKGATQSFESALGLLSEDDEPEMNILRAQAHFGCGIANFLQGDIDAALANLELALESAEDNVILRGQVTVLLAQTMWASQNDELRENSKAHLLECIASDPDDLTAVNTLAGLGVLTDDQSLVDAALSELLTLPRERRLQRDPERNVDHMLAHYHLGQQDPKKAVAVAQGALFGEPSRSEARAWLATLMLQKENSDAALALLSGLAADNPTLLRLRAIALSRENSKEAMRDIQRAVMLAPSDSQCWRAMALQFYILE
ncbi:hypothetical protein H0H93_010222 [Arthromyces matolae]|nr:hypothetical protein H0H93_010222 [Arthromyces matolae]